MRCASLSEPVQIRSDKGFQPRRQIGVGLNQENVAVSDVDADYEIDEQILSPEHVGEPRGLSLTEPGEEPVGRHETILAKGEEIQLGTCIALKLGEDLREGVRAPQPEQPSLVGIARGV